MGKEPKQKGHPKGCPFFVGEKKFKFLRVNCKSFPIFAAANEKPL